MNSPSIFKGHDFKSVVFKRNLLKSNVWIALSLMLLANNAQSACVDNSNGTYTCTGDSENNNALISGTIILDNVSGPVNLTNTTNDGTTLTGPGTTDIYGSFYPDIGAILRNSTATVEQTNTLISNGSSAIVINNFGSNITVDGAARVFDQAAWTSDANGLLYNGGILAGYASAIRSDAATQSLTVNNANIMNNIFYPGLQTLGLYAFIRHAGEYSAAIHTNSALLTVNSTGNVGDVVSFAGATYTAPTVLDGTQFATNVVAGTTVINASQFGGLGNLYVVDKNPLLTSAQEADPSLVLAYSAAEVGPRNSIINLNEGYIANIYLGSGAHIINATQGGIGNIFVDQRDSEVIDVAGGVATPLYKVHGDRTFTLNSSVTNSGVGVGDITINDVAGAVNTVNLTVPVNSYIFNTFTAQGLGNNTLNVNCFDSLADAFNSQNRCSWQLANVTGFTDFNLSGSGFELYGNYTVTGDINLTATSSIFDARSTMTANNVIVGNNAILAAPGGVTGYNKTMGSIVGNLINNGTVNVGDATLNITGDATMQTGSKFIVDIGPTQVGQINALGNSNFASGSIIAPTINPNAFTRDGDSHIVATNATSIPTVENGTGFVQWSADNASGNLVITANLAVPDRLLSKVTPAAVNAVDAFFSYKGNALLSTELQAELQQFDGINVIRASERLRPEINDSAIRMVLGNTDKLFSILDHRLLETYLHHDTKAAAADGNEPLKVSKGLWVQGFGDRGSQQSLQGADGYDVSVAGMAMGADRALDAFNGDTRVGFALGYARGNTTNSGNTVNNRIDTNSYLASIYASYNQPDWYVNGAIAAGRNTYDSRRQLVQHTATGEHDGWQFSSRIDAGWPILFDEHLTFIPVASLDYSHINESGYQENGKVSRPVLDYSRTDIPPQPVYLNGVPQFTLENSPINLAIASRSFDSIRSGIGGKAIYAIQQQDWAAELELHGLYRHEFGNLAQDSSAKFVAGGRNFSSAGIKPIRDDFILGASLRLTSDDEDDQITLLTSYDANFREKYFGQTMSLNVRYDFDQAPSYIKNAKAKLAAQQAKEVPTQLMTASEKDVAAIQAATQDEAGEVANPEHSESQAAIDKTINTWATALSNKSLDIYFNSYAADFVTPDGSSRQQWERKRKLEISKAPNPAIKISYLTIKPNGTHAVAIFTQATVENTQSPSTQNSSASADTVQKIVDLALKNGRWLIVREDSVAL